MRFARALAIPSVVVAMGMLHANCTYSVGELRDLDAQPPEAGSEGAAPDASDGGCGNTATDPKNCGACGHDCLGQPCSSGRCEPAVLSKDQNDPRSIGVDDAKVYWGSGGTDGVWSCDKSCVDGPMKVSDEDSAVVAIVVTTFDVFWAKKAELKHLVKATGDIVGLDNGVVSNVVALAADETSVWFTYDDTAKGGVARCPIAAGCDGTNGPEILANDYDRPVALALAPGGFAFAAGTPARSVLYCAPQCLNPADNLALVVADNQAEPGTIAIAETSAFFSNTLAAPDDAVVRASLAAPHAPTTLAKTEAPGPLVLDGGFVYWLGTKDGSLHKVSKNGGADVLLALGLPAPRALAVDDRRVYIANAGPKGNLVWVAK